jgi:hypothetical protein
MVKRTKNPRDEFEAARKRGMTEEEVRWVVEDFLETGILDWESVGVPLDQLTKRRDKEYEWYLGILVEGFGLTRQQRKEAENALEKIKEADSEHFLAVMKSAKEYLTHKDPFAEESELRTRVPGDLVRGVSIWAQGEKISPWNLCTLDEAQKSMLPLRLEDGQWIWDRSGSVTLDYGTAERYENLDDPFTDLWIFVRGGDIFPLSMAQVDGIRGAEFQLNSTKHPDGVPDPPLFEQLKFLTAPQLRTLLLYEPEVAGSLVKELGEHTDSINEE